MRKETQITTPIIQADVGEIMAKFENDPLGFVLWAFPWQEPRTQLAFDFPDRWQIAVLEDLGKALVINANRPKDQRVPIQIAVASGHGIGKAQPLDLEIDTPNGKKLWGDLKPGDLLFGRDGNPTRIKTRHDHKNVKMYRVFFDDGSHTDCCEDHLWTVKGRNQRRKKEGWIVLSTKQILSFGVKRKNGTKEARQWEVPRNLPVQYPEKNTPIHPYVLGVWLGDGTRNSSRITSNDYEVIERLKAIGEKITKEKTPFMYGVSMLKRRLKLLGISDRFSYQKSVPPIYMENSEKVRSEILRGLLDTDGEAAKHGSVVFSSTSKALVEDVVWLARSLGGKARIQPTAKKTTHKDCYRATLTMPCGFRCFYIERKQSRIHVVEERYLSRWIDRIESLPNADAMCVTVDAKDSLYLTNDFIVTHNTALIAWIVLWFLSTHVCPRAVVTANTFKQLSGKTWAELHKWHSMMLHKHLFEWTAEKYYLKDNPAEWKAEAIPWSKENSEAFAGTHAVNVLYVYDEGSAVDDKIWEVSEGAMTTECCLWVVFGNPTRNTGRFRECFAKFRHRWITRSIDSRTARKTNKTKIKQWIEDYGEDSDFVRVRVRGRFPKLASNQLFSEERVDYCMNVYKAIGYEFYPISICVDVARKGDDMTTVGVWQGKKGHELRGFAKDGNGKRTVIMTATAAAYAYRHYQKLYPRVRIRIFVDDCGVGGGVTDVLESWGLPVTGVDSGAGAHDPEKFTKIRSEMWWRGAQAVEDGYELPKCVQLKEDLVNITYDHSVPAMKIQVEKVEDLKDRGLPSPDYGTNFVLQFAYPQLLDIKDETAAQAARSTGGSTTMQKRRQLGYGQDPSQQPRRLI